MFIEFTTNPDNTRIAINPDNVKSVTRVTDTPDVSIIHYVNGGTQGIKGKWDEVVQKLNGK